MATTRNSDRAGIALVLIAVAAGFGQFAAVASLGDIAHHFGHRTHGSTFVDVVGISGTVLGTGLAVMRLAGLFALPMTSLADRWGRKKVLRRVAIAGLALTALAAGSPSYWAFVAFFALARPLLSASTTLIQVITVEISSPQRRVHRLAWIAAGAGLGSGTSAILHGLLPGPNGFRLLFATAALPALAVTPLLRHIREPDERYRGNEELLARLGSIPKAYRRQMVTVAILTVVLGIITGPANGFAFAYGESVLKISRHEVALVVFFSAAGGFAGLMVGRWLADRIGRRWTVGGGIVGTALTSTFAYSGGRERFIAGYLVGVFAAAVLAPAASALINEIFPHSIRATTAGWAVVANVVGAIIGLSVFGLVGDVAHVSSSVNALRVPALVTFLPTLPLLWLLKTLPETRGSPID